MNKVILMVGLSGSGKSHKAKFLSEKNNAIIISSDDIRKELFNNENDQEHNDIVFSELHKRVRQNLQNGKNSIIDATNLTMKSRRSAITNIKQTKIPCEIMAYVMTKDFENCVRNDFRRERTVGKDVIYQQMKKFQIPFFEEGIDKIILENYSNREATTEENFKAIVEGMYDFPQQNRHHKYDLFTHCYKTYELLTQVEANSSLLMAALLHDIGKMETKTKNDNGEYSYYHHANVGTYQLLNEIKLPNDIPNAFAETLNVLFYINYHMLPFDWNEEQTKAKYIEIFGETKFKNLLLLHHCDKIASGVQLN